jgi:hypothetical protein
MSKINPISTVATIATAEELVQLAPTKSEIL